jgi:hypothetical protein
MTDDTPASNRKAPDRLAALRARIAALKVEEEILRQGFITGELDPVGDEYVVTVETKVNERIYLQSMRENLPEEVWRPFLVEKPVTYVNVKRKVAPLKIMTI